MNTAFQNAVIGAVILGLIEGVSIVFQSMQMRKQHQQMQEMQKMQIEEMKRAQRQAQNNPWEAGFEEGQKADAKSTDGEDGFKSYSFE